MKSLLSFGLSFIVGVVSLPATQWPSLPLGELLTGADLVVVGKIVSAEGKVTPPPQAGGASLAHTWKSELEITRVLKGELSGTTLTVSWEEIRLSGAPEYQLGEERIWILKNAEDRNVYSTEGRPDTVRRLDELPSVERELKKQSPNQAGPDTPPGGGLPAK